MYNYCIIESCITDIFVLLLYNRKLQHWSFLFVENLKKTYMLNWNLRVKHFLKKSCSFYESLLGTSVQSVSRCANNKFYTAIQATKTSQKSMDFFTLYCYQLKHNWHSSINRNLHNYNFPNPNTFHWWVKLYVPIVPCALTFAFLCTNSTLCSGALTFAFYISCISSPIENVRTTVFLNLNHARVRFLFSESKLWQPRFIVEQCYAVHSRHFLPLTKTESL